MSIINDGKGSILDLKSYDRLRAVVEALLDGVVTIDAQGRILDLNPAVESIFGYGRDELLGCNVSSLMHTPDAEAHQAHVQRYLATGERRIIGKGRRVQARRKDGSSIDISLAVTESVIDGQPVFTGILRDVTAEVRRERELERRQNELLAQNRVNDAIQQATSPEQLIDASLAALTSFSESEVRDRAAIFLVEDANGQGNRRLDRPSTRTGRSSLRLARSIGYFSPEFLAQATWMPMNGCPCGRVAEGGETLVSDRCFNGSHHAHCFTDVEAHGHYMVPLKARGMVVGVALLYTSPGPTSDVRRVALLDTLGSQIGVALDRLWTDHELRQSRANLHRLAVQDELTGLPNRRAIIDRLAQERARCGRLQGSVAVLILDIDRFKQINDNFGHSVGDAVLVETGHRIREALRPYDQVGRYGGEEFVVVLPEADQTTAVAIGERIRNALAGTPFRVAGHELEVTASLGVAVSEGYPEAELTEEILLAKADRALYRAKRDGRNRVELDYPNESLQSPFQQPEAPGVTQA